MNLVVHLLMSFWIPLWKKIFSLVYSHSPLQRSLYPNEISVHPTLLSTSQKDRNHLVPNQNCIIDGPTVQTQDLESTGSFCWPYEENRVLSWSKIFRKFPTFFRLDVLDLNWLDYRESFAQLSRYWCWSS